ncbi:MAG: hypothetical protein F4X17_01760 [Gemmatimonadetes bacterium]|nr:hypothetical protein [Gemmatimonadota bacterium]MYI61526.1 hypothetical protein [Gemmatimonadota bacterium]
MQKPPVKHIRAALDIIKELDAIKSHCTEAFDPSSQAAAENTVANRSGMDSKIDLVSIPGTRLHLHLKLYAAREHLLACIYLVGSDAERTLVNPIQASARMALEAVATCLWLCSNEITWVERLRRHSQLHLQSTHTSLKEARLSLDAAPHKPGIEEEIAELTAECASLLDWVKERGWTCRRKNIAGKEPTVSTWVEELPRPTELVKEGLAILPLPPEVIHGIYSVYSRSVHTDPVTVAGGTTEEDALARLSIAVGATTNTLLMYELAWRLFASWCSVPYPEEAIRRLITDLGPES